MAAVDRREARCDTNLCPYTSDLMSNSRRSGLQRAEEESLITAACPHTHKNGYKWQVSGSLPRCFPPPFFINEVVHDQNCSVLVHFLFFFFSLSLSMCVCVYVCVGDKVQHHHGHTWFHRLSQCLLLGGGVVGVGVLVEGREQRLQG